MTQSLQIIIETPFPYAIVICSQTKVTIMEPVVESHRLTDKFGIWVAANFIQDKVWKVAVSQWIGQGQNQYSVSA